MQQKEYYVEMKEITKHYGKLKAADQVSLKLEKGKLLGLLGPSGSGKTTMLRILAGLEMADSGSIYIDGKRVDQVEASKRGIGFVFQNYALFRYKTVYENIAFGLKIAKWKRGAIKKRVEELIALVGLSGMEHRYPSQLSGGQCQRVAFARALAPEPQLLLLDEPFAALDAKVRKELRSWLKKMIEQLQITSIFVTHDQNEAIEVADEIIIMNHGKIEQKGTAVAVYSNPQTAFTAAFLGESNYLKSYRKLKGFEQCPEGEDAILRSEYVTISKKTEPITYPLTTENGVVEQVTFQGNVWKILVRVKGELLTAYRQFGEVPVQEKELVNVFIQRLFVITDATEKKQKRTAAIKMYQNRVLEQQEIVFI